MSLDAIVPKQHNGNYSSNGKEQAGTAKRALFDSRA
jgi:hypothetical protein